MAQVFYTDAHPESVCCDGYAARYHVGGEAWADLLSGAGNSKDSSATASFCGWWAGSSANEWSKLHRLILLFDTTNLSTEATIVNATIELYCLNKKDQDILGNPGWGQLDLVACQVTPASNTDIAYADYGTFGSTVFSGAKPYISILEGTYNTFQLNQDGINAINAGGITKFGIRSWSHDILATAPNWKVELQSYANFAMAEYGVEYRPKLVINATPIEEIKDRVTKHVHRVGYRHYTSELILGGLAMRWLYKESVAQDSEGEIGAVGESEIMYEIVDGQMKFFWLKPDGTKEYIENL